MASGLRKLTVVVAPDQYDRNTEVHFKDMFDNDGWIWCPTKQDPIERPLPYFNKQDTLIFEGGTDISPAIYGQDNKHSQKPNTLRDAHEMRVFRHAKDSGAAMIGICRGAQLLCAMNGGSIIQDVTGHNPKDGSHQIMLPECFNRTMIRATSAHHQMMNPYKLPKEDWWGLGHAMTLSERYLTDKGKLRVYKEYGSTWKEQEIIWFPKTRCLCIQGHPEYYQTKFNPFVMYCRFLIKALIFGEKTEYDLQAG